MQIVVDSNTVIPDVGSADSDQDQMHGNVSSDDTASQLQSVRPATSMSASLCDSEFSYGLICNLTMNNYVDNAYRELASTTRVTESDHELRIYGFKYFYANDVLCAASPVTSEIKPLARASSDAELQTSADSGPLSPAVESSLELIQPTMNFGSLSMPGQPDCTVQPRPLHREPAVCLAQLWSASFQPDDSAPAGPGSVSPVVGSREPNQHHISSAGGPNRGARPAPCLIWTCKATSRPGACQAMSTSAPSPATFQAISWTSAPDLWRPAAVSHAAGLMSLMSHNFADLWPPVMF